MTQGLRHHRLLDAIFALFTRGAALGFSAAASPGPFQAYLLSRAARSGIGGALPLALAPLLSDGPVVAVVLLALSTAPAWLLRGLGIGGGAFLLWMAWGAARSLREPVAAATTSREGTGGSLLRAAVVNAAGPGPWVFWSTVCGPILVEAWRAAPSSGLAFLAGFYAMLVGGNAAVVVVSGLAGRAGPRAARALGVASAALLAVLGAVQLWRGLRGT
jgi:threonine/homoserine/homoserine lactone efflux protein